MVDRVLRETGKTFDDLQQSVLARQQRKDLRAQLDRCVELQKPQAKLQKQIAAADRDLEEAESRHAQITGPLYAQLLLERATINETVVAKCQAELVEVERELALLIQREELLREQTLVP